MHGPRALLPPGSLSPAPPSLTLLRHSQNTLRPLQPTPSKKNIPLLGLRASGNPPLIAACPIVYLLSFCRLLYAACLASSPASRLYPSPPPSLPPPQPRPADAAAASLIPGFPPSRPAQPPVSTSPQPPHFVAPPPPRQPLASTHATPTPNTPVSSLRILGPDARSFAQGSLFSRRWSGRPHLPRYSSGVLQRLRLPCASLLFFAQHHDLDHAHAHRMP